MDGDPGHEVVGRVQGNEVRRMLHQAEKKGQGVADEHAFENGPGTYAHEEAADAAVAHAQRLEGAHGGDIPEQHDQQAAHHIEAGHNRHEDEDDQHIEVQQLQPVEDLGILLL